MFRNSKIGYSWIFRIRIGYYNWIFIISFALSFVFFLELETRALMADSFRSFFTNFVNIT